MVVLLGVLAFALLWLLSGLLSFGLAVRWLGDDAFMFAFHLLIGPLAFFCVSGELFVRRLRPDMYAFVDWYMRLWRKSL